MTHNPDVIENFIRNYLAQNATKKGINLAQISGESNILELGVIDSLGFVQMLMKMEAELGLELDLVELDPDEFTSLQGLVNVALAASAK